VLVASIVLPLTLLPAARLTGKRGTAPGEAPAAPKGAAPA
jgi:hypothetical protein